MTPCLLRLCVTTLLALLFCLPAHAQVDISGPPAAVHAVQTWFDAHVPAKFRRASRLPVRLLDADAMDAYIKQGDAASAHAGDNENDSDGFVDGLYESDPDAITLLLPAKGTPDTFTLGHEYGHYVWFQILSRDDRRRYKALYNQQRAARHLVTEYAATDAEEGFAEAFSFYVNQPPLLAWRDPLSFQFLSHWPAPLPTAPAPSE